MFREVPAWLAPHHEPNGQHVLAHVSPTGRHVRPPSPAPGHQVRIWVLGGLVGVSAGSSRAEPGSSGWDMDPSSSGRTYPHPWAQNLKVDGDPVLRGRLGCAPVWGRGMQLEGPPAPLEGQSF